jgi:hypothetical protein
LLVIYTIVRNNYLVACALWQSLKLRNNEYIKILNLIFKMDL